MGKYQNITGRNSLHLSSLRSLDLSQNNFVSLPKSINQLSRLEKLALKDCVLLEALPGVPLKVQKVKLDGCLRLKVIPDPIKLSSQKRSEFKCLNCWEVYKHNSQNNMGLNMLERYLQVFSSPYPILSLSLSETFLFYDTGLISKTWIWYCCSWK